MNKGQNESALEYLKIIYKTDAPNDLEGLLTELKVVTQASKSANTAEK